MCVFDQAVEQERLRLVGVIAEAKEKVTELQGQIAADELRIEALDAYDQAKGGKASGGKAAKRGIRRPKTGSSAGSPPEPTEGYSPQRH